VNRREASLNSDDSPKILLGCHGMLRKDES
jgi:hypothetical protein